MRFAVLIYSLCTHFVLEAESGNMIDVLVLLLGTGLIVYGVFKWGTLNYDYFAKRGLKHLKPYFLVGNMGGFFLGKYSMNEFVMSMYNNFPTEK